jgi:hypothetical protein
MQLSHNKVQRLNHLGLIAKKLSPDFLHLEHFNIDILYKSARLRS